MLEPKDGQTKQRQRLFPIFVSALRAALFLYFFCISLLYFYVTFLHFCLHCYVPFRSSISLHTMFTISKIVFKHCMYFYYGTFMFACVLGFYKYV